MKLGNSNGNNRGKKYFLRKNYDSLQPTKESRNKANVFGEWFTKNINVLTNFLKLKLCYDEDVFATTFMRMYEKILFTSMDVKDYKAYFHRSYYTNYIQNRIHENRYGDPLLSDNRIDSTQDAKELEYLQMMLENDVFNYVYEHYALHEFEVFKMYVSLKPAINYQTLATITNIKAYTIQRIISKIMQDIRKNKKFVERYSEIVA